MPEWRRWCDKEERSAADTARDAMELRSRSASSIQTLPRREDTVLHLHMLPINDAARLIKEEQNGGVAVQTMHSFLWFLMFSTTDVCECFESLCHTHTHTSVIKDHDGIKTQMLSATAELRWLPLFSCLANQHDLVDVRLQRSQTVSPQGEMCLVL